jgi:hypothetical protein
MGYDDVDQSNEKQYALWWRIEELDEYSRRRTGKDLDIVKYLLDLPDTHPATAEDCAQVAFAFGGQEARDRFRVGARGLQWETA